MLRLIYQSIRRYDCVGMTASASNAGSVASTQRQQAFAVATKVPADLQITTEAVLE